VIFRNLWRRRTRTILTLIGIGLGVGAIVALVAIGNGLMGGFVEMFSGSEADLVVSQADVFDPSMSALDENLRDQLASLTGVASVTGMLNAEAAADGLPYMMLLGHEPDGFAIERYKLVEGEGLSSRSRHEIIIGKLVADGLNKGVGDSMKLYDSAFRIVGIYETGTGMEDGGGVITLSDAQTMMKKSHQVSMFQIKLKRVEDADRAREAIERRFDDLVVTRSGEYANKEMLMQIVAGLAWGIAFLAILIGGVGMMNTMLMSIFERTREIGVLRALGWRKARVLRMILMESLVLSVIGGALGAVLGVVTVRLLGAIPATAGILQGEFSLSLFVQAFMVALGLGALGGFYPAWRASRLDPLLAMQYDADRGGGASKHWPGGMIVRNLMRRRIRSVLTMLGIAIAVAAIVGLGGMLEGFGEQFVAMGAGGQADLMALDAGVSDMAYSAVDEKIAKRIAAIPQVESVSGMIASVAPAENNPFMIVMGYSPHESAIKHFEIADGEPLSATRQAIIGRLAADSMDKKVGDPIDLVGSRFRIVGIYETGTPLEDTGVVISLREAQALFGRPRQTSFVGIELRDPRQADSVLQELAARFPEIRVSKTAEFAESIPDFRAMDVMIGGISFLAVLVGGVGVMNTVFMSVFERTREIGVLRALGWRKRRILGMVMQESILLSFVSGLVGVLLGMAFGQIFRALLPYLVPQYPPELILRAVILALTLGTISGILPAWWASRLDPLEALRYE